ncbi:MAG: hypothetical protein WEE89_09880 [Gemmatimonadota bacterium]
MPAPYPDALRARLSEVLRHDLDTPLADSEFDTIARDIFSFQFEHNHAYAAYCRRRGVVPEQLQHWTAIPPVPTAAFREVALVAGTPDQGMLRFKTSGTTHGREKRGVHYIPDPHLYEEALLPMFAGYLLPDAARPAMISLIPHSAQALDSSLSRMVSYAAEQVSADAFWFMDADRGLQELELEATLRELIADDSPILIVGTSFAFVHWLDSLSTRGLRFRLPERSRIMDTGGFKGKSRSVPEAELRAACQTFLAVAEPYCINEYGMTELCSQFYDTTLRDRVLDRPASPVRLKRPAPWVRTRVVDPETLTPVTPGEVGILQHIDLANLYSVLAVQTEDFGRAHGDAFETLGRAPGAVPRGCSVAVDLLLQAVKDTR